MGDLVAVAGTVAFFVLATLYAMWCDRIVGPAPTVAAPGDPIEPSVAAEPVEAVEAVAR